MCHNEDLLIAAESALEWLKNAENGQEDNEKLDNLLTDLENAIIDERLFRLPKVHVERVFAWCKTCRRITRVFRMDIGQPCLSCGRPTEEYNPTQTLT